MFSVGLVLAAGVCLAGWLLWYQPKPVVEIQAGREAELGLPVYAQFMVRQTVTLERAENIIGLIVPMYFPDSGKHIYVRLHQAEQELGEWEVSGAGIRELHLDLDAVQFLAGELTVEFDGRELRGDERESAPRVFVEKDNNGYISGRYSIAGNTKAGDVALEVWGRERRGRPVWESWKREPITGVAQVAAVAALGFLLGALPYTLRNQAKSDENPRPYTNRGSAAN